MMVTSKEPSMVENLAEVLVGYWDKQMVEKKVIALGMRLVVESVCSVAEMMVLMLVSSLVEQMGFCLVERSVVYLEL
jgi:hypothetical protein